MANEADFAPVSNFEGRQTHIQRHQLPHVTRKDFGLFWGKEKCGRIRETNECCSFLHYPGKGSWLILKESPP
jgi:hypothetical protein